jgi:M6 family metalloprotease-like protein
MRLNARFRARPDWLGRAVILWAGCFAVSVVPVGDSPFGPTEAGAQQASVSGHLSSIWEDPLPDRGTPRLRHFLSTRDGEMVPLRVTDSQLRAVGGVEGGNGQYVQISGDWRATAKRPGAKADRELEVRSIGYSVDAAGASPPPQGAPITGSHPWVTVLCRFSDYPATEPHPLSWYETLMGGTEPGVDHYWRELSFDLANVSGSGALGWYDLPQPRATYVNDSTGVANLQLLKDDCAAVADADIHFPDYVGINFQFNESLGGFSWGGGSSLNIDGVFKSYRMTWLADWADHVTYTHEMGHGFGLPHSSGPYGAVYDSNWDVMSGAWTNHDSFWGWIAPHTISYHKNLLGWIPPARIYEATVGSSQTITLHRLADLGAGGDYLMARVPRSDGTYYTVEARRDLGYDGNLPAQAVIMHHVTSRAFVVDPDNNGNPDDAGARWLPGETFTDGANGITVSVNSETPEGYVVTISVREPGHIVLAPTSLAFSTQQGTDPASQTFAIQNTGIGELQWIASDDATWLNLGASSGSIASAGSSDVTVSVAAASLAPSSYNGTVTIAGNANNAPQTLAVSLEVTAAPVITLLAEPLDLEAVVGVDPPVHEIVIRNDGGADLNWTAASDAPWMTFARGSGTLAPGASETDSVAVSVAGLALGDYTGTLTFSGDASNSPQTLDATLSVTLSPSIALTGTFEFEAYEGDIPEAAELTVGNDGGGTLHWTAAASQAWVILTPASGDVASGSDQAVEVGVDVSGLGAGTHTGVITVSGNADDSPQTVAVEFVVRARPHLVAQDVADQLMGVRTPLSASDLEYLDDTGNGNGSFDAGDFRAWLQAAGLMSRVGPTSGEGVAP